jgi:hypothetical protein
MRTRSQFCILLWAALLVQGCAWLPIQDIEPVDRSLSEEERRALYLNERVFMVQKPVDGSKAECDFCTVVMDDLRAEAFLQTKSYVAASFVDPRFFDMDWNTGVMSRREFLSGFRAQDTMVVADVTGSTLRAWLARSLAENAIRQSGMRITVLLSEPAQIGSVLIERDILEPQKRYRIATTHESLTNFFDGADSTGVEIVWTAPEAIEQWLIQKNETKRELRQTQTDQRLIPVS